MIKLEKKRYPS